MTTSSPPSAAPALVRLRDNPAYVDVKEAGRRLGVSKQWTMHLIRRGRLHAVQDAISRQHFVALTELDRITTPVPTRHTAPVQGPPPPFRDDDDLVAEPTLPAPS